MEKQTLKHQFYLYYSHSHSHCLVIKDETFSKRKMVENILQSPFHQLLLLLFSFSFHPLRDILLSLSHRQGSIILILILILILLPHSQSHMPFHCKGDVIFSIHPFSTWPILGTITCVCPFQVQSRPIFGLFGPAHFSPNLGLFVLPILGPFTPNPNTFVFYFGKII